MTFFVAVTIFTTPHKILLYDGSINLFNIVNNKWFSFDHNRFINYPVQLPVVLLTYFDVPFKILLYVYALTVIAIPVSIYVYIHLKYKDIHLEWAFIIILYFMSIHGFFFHFSELWLGAYLIFLIVVVFQNEDVLTTPYVFIIPFLILLLVFSHLLLLVPLFIIVGFLWLNRPKSSNILLLTVASTVVFLGIKLLFFKASYPAGRIGDFNIIETLGSLHQSVLINELLLSFTNFNLPYTLLFISLVGFALLNRKQFKIQFYFGFIGILLYIFFIALIDHQIKYSMYIDCHLKPISLIIAIAFYWAVSSNLKHRRILKVITAILILSNVLLLWQSNKVYADKFDAYKSLVTTAQEYDQQKVILYSDNCGAWNCHEAPYLTALVSNLMNVKSVSCFMTSDSIDLPSNPSVLLFKGKTVPIEEVNNSYFDFSKESSYVVIEDIYSERTTRHIFD